MTVLSRNTTDVDTDRAYANLPAAQRGWAEDGVDRSPFHIWQTGVSGRAASNIYEKLFDCVDIHIEVPRVDYEKLSGDRLGETSAKIRKRVEAARERQRTHFAGTNLQCKGDMGPQRCGSSASSMT